MKTWRMEPLPESLSTTMRPPCAATMERQMNRPRPQPFWASGARPCSKGLNRRSHSARGIPRRSGELEGVLHQIEQHLLHGGDVQEDFHLQGGRFDVQVAAEAPRLGLQ